MIEDESRANLEVAPVQQGYARWSETYDVQDNPLIILEEPLVRSLQGEVQGLKVADIGCGTGRHTVQLSEAGARVTAIDFAPEMMAQAIEKTKDQEVRFVTHDLTERFPFDSDAFDRVLCCLVLEHIPDLDPVIREMARICRPGGFVLISELHPAMFLRRVQARFTDTKTGLKVNVESYRHLIADYVNAALKANLQIDLIEEHLADECLLEKSPRAKEYWNESRDDFDLGWPMLLLMKLGKPLSGPAHGAQVRSRRTLGATLKKAGDSRVRICTFQIPMAADVSSNVSTISRCLSLAAQSQADLAVFPEMAVVGYDFHLHGLFQQEGWYSKVQEGMETLAADAKELGLKAFIGTPFALGVSCDVVVTDGIRYRMYEASKDFAPVAYANLIYLGQQ